jgi:hypothetical protein
MLLGLKSRIQHIQRHLITILRSRDSDKPLIAIFGRFIDFTRILAGTTEGFTYDFHSFVESR